MRTQHVIPRHAAMRDHAATIVGTLITSNQPLSRAQIAELTGLTVAQLAKPLRALVDAGRVVATGATVTRRYTVMPAVAQSEHAAKTQAAVKSNADAMTAAVRRVALRDRVIKAVLAQPGKLNKAALARHVGATLEDVEEAVAWHIARDRVQRDETGCYARTREGARTEAGQ